MPIQIEYQSIGLNKEKIEELKEKIKKFYRKLKTPNLSIDFSNTREGLNDCEEALRQTTNEEERYNILMSYITIYEEFINNLKQIILIMKRCLKNTISILKNYLKNM